MLGNKRSIVMSTVNAMLAQKAAEPNNNGLGRQTINTLLVATHYISAPRIPQLPFQTKANAINANKAEINKTHHQKQHKNNQHTPKLTL